MGEGRKIASGRCDPNLQENNEKLKSMLKEFSNKSLERELPSFVQINL